MKELKEDVEEKNRQYVDATTDLESVQQDKCVPVLLFIGVLVL